jgi:hypothetical protein
VRREWIQSRTDIETVLFSLIYNVPLFVLCAFWLFFRRQEWKRRQLFRALLDGAVVLIGLARFYGSTIPPSGHAVFLTHTLVSIDNRYYRLAALSMLMATVGLKISWGDYTSWSHGVVIGMISGLLWMRAGEESGAAVPSGE